MNPQDIAAIALAVAAAAWLARRVTKRLAAPPCGAVRDLPAGADGFVPLDGLATPPAHGGARHPVPPASPPFPG